jgi:hypothetical protein
MNRRRLKWIIGLTAALLALSSASAVTWRSLAEWNLPADNDPASGPPRIRPDYADITIPPNIAPPNFIVEEPGVEYRVHLHGAKGIEAKGIVVGSRNSSIVIPQRPWRQLLEKNRGGRIAFEVYVKDSEGRWSHFAPFGQDVAAEPIDSHVVYRLLGPVCNLYRDMGLYQRNVENFDESPLLATSDSFDGCVNCHSFAANRPDRFALQVRPGMSKEKVKGGMFLVRGHQITELKTESAAAPQRPSYIAWHPNGSTIAFSMTKTKQVFHATGAEMREGFDTASHLALVNIETGAVSTAPGIADPAMQEAFPCWSPDGKSLYFCRAKSLWAGGRIPRIEEFKNVQYDLVRVSYDVAKNEVGACETVLAAAETGLSIGEPKVSPNGHYLLFSMADHGSFYPFQTGSDLGLLDLETGAHRRLECSAEGSDAWHSWSSNSRWIVFSSRRDVPLISRLYISYIDPQGKASKPFLLPREDPTSYDSLLKSFDVPEMVAGPIEISERELLAAVRASNTRSAEPQKSAEASGHPRK